MDEDGTMTRNEARENTARFWAALLHHDRLTEDLHAAIGTSAEAGAEAQLQVASDELAVLKPAAIASEGGAPGGRVWFNERRVWQRDIPA